MKKLMFILGFVAGCCFVGFSQTTIVQESVGQGATRDEAIKNGLYNAVAQAKGVHVGSGDYEFGFRSATADVNRTGTGKSIEFDAVSVETAGSVLRTDVAGLVKTYEVLEEKKTDDGNYQVKLKVWVLDYAALDNANRIRVAIMPIRTPKATYQFGFLMPGEDIAEQLSQKLTDSLAATNKFMVLDREYDEEFLKEKMVLRADGSIDEKAKLNEVLGCDYVLTGTISDAVLLKNQEKLAATGYDTTEYKGRFVFDYRLIGGPTRHVRTAGTIDLVFETEDVKALFEQWEPDKIDTRQIGDAMIAEAARQAAETIVEDFYPMRVASVDAAGTIIVNQGSKRLTEGLLLDVYAQSGEITDPDTGEILGKTEVKVATIEINKAVAGMAYATVVDGDLTKISKGCICKYTPVEQMQEGRRSNIEKKPDGGVKMPFD